jgi:outer membrane immunogenic protein
MIDASYRVWDGSVSMRRFLLAAAMFAATTCARAADMPDFLRGGYAPVPAVRNWDGWYVGGQADYSVAKINLGQTEQSLVNFILRDTIIQEQVSGLTVLGSHHEQSFGFGAFVGRNWQWEDVVLGVEANYVHMNGLTASESNFIARRIDNPPGSSLPAGHTDEFNAAVAGNAQLQIKDVMTFRGRAGWVCGDFLPYMFGGLAVGRIAASRSASVTVVETDIDNTVTPATTTLVSVISDSASDGRSNTYAPGWTAGLGTEMAIFGNLFARVEWEYIRFVNVKGMQSEMNSAHLGIGYKF